MRLQHSAKGSTWKEHKYIKRVNGTYFYPKGYEGGRQMSDSEDTKAFDEFENYCEELMKQGKAYWDPDETRNMSKEELADLYEDMTGVKLGEEDAARLHDSMVARKNADSNAEKSQNENSIETKKENKLSDEDVEALANEVIRGNFGNGSVRKELLGEDYSEIQERVNEIIKKNKSTTKTAEVKHSEIYHHGVKGQRWGVRRYQNTDGTLTSAGRRRLRGSGVNFDDDGRVSNDSNGRARGAVHQTVASDYKNVSAGLQSASNAAKAASSINDRSASRKQSKAMEKMDLSSMTDKELQAAINRLNLERNYKSLSTEHVRTGRDYISSFLSTTGDVLTVGASAASILMVIHQLKS